MTEKITIGNAEVWALLDMVPPPYTPQDFFPSVPLGEWEPYRAEVLNSEGNLQLYYGCFVIRSQGKLILVDTGMGPGPHPEWGNLCGDLVNQIRAEGLSPEEIDYVAHTHLHGDHVGWNVTGEGKASFPKARYLVPRADWDFFTQPRQMEEIASTARSVTPLKALGVMDLVEGDHQITSEVSTLATPGHTPGHMAVIIRSQGEVGIVVGDVIQSVAQVMEPQWGSRADIDGEEARRTRVDLVDRVQREGMVMAAGHFPTGSHFGRIVLNEGRRYWQVASP